MGVALMLLQISANNWRKYGSIFGGNEIIRLMLSRDLLVLGIVDGLMCGCTIVCLLLQKGIARGYLGWSRWGWVLQNVSLWRKLVRFIEDLLTVLTSTRFGKRRTLQPILPYLGGAAGLGHTQSSSPYIVLLCL